MLNMRTLLNKISNDLIDFSPELSKLSCPDRIELLDGQMLFRSDRLYIGSEIAEGAMGEDGAVLVLCDGASPIIPQNCLYIKSSAPLIRLYNTVSELIANASEKHLQANSEEELSFLDFWDSVVERKIITSVEIRSALARMPYPVGAFVRLAIINFANIDESQLPAVLKRIKALIPAVNVAAYNGDIIMLLSSDERLFHWSFDKKEEIEALLQEYDGYMIVQNSTRDLSALSFLGKLTKQTLTIVRELAAGEPRRIVYFEEYSLYYVIDLCAQRFMDLNGSNDIIYLVHPAIIALTRYDRDHNNNLRDVLYYYLRNDRNLVKTASDTFMHRNTVVNKVNKIDEIIDLDLEDDGLRQRLIFSCQVIRYYENVLKLDLKL